MRFLANICSSFVGQVGKALGEKWKALNAKQREPYEAKAKADKERYESEKAAYAVSPLALMISCLLKCQSPAYVWFLGWW